MGRRTSFTVLAFLLTLPAAGTAQTLGSLQWVGTGASFAANFKNPGDQITVYAGAAYKANAAVPGGAPWYLQSSNGFGPAVDILCIDFLNTAKKTTYAAYFTNLKFDALTHTRGTDLEKYRQVAWLTTQMETLPFTNDGKQERAEVHAAIWSVLSGQPNEARRSGGVYGTSGTRIAGWVDDAQLYANTVNLAHFTVVTADCNGAAGNEFAKDNCGQEFLVHTPDIVTPEPGTMLLLATGLMAVVGGGRRARRRRQAAEAGE